MRGRISRARNVRHLLRFGDGGTLICLGVPARLVIGWSLDCQRTTSIGSRVKPRSIHACRFVDEVIPEENWAQKPHDIRDHGVSIFAMGDDWAGKFDELKTYCQVVYLPRTPVISTTLIKDTLRGDTAAAGALADPRLQTV